MLKKKRQKVYSYSVKSCYSRWHDNIISVVRCEVTSSRQYLSTKNPAPKRSWENRHTFRIVFFFLNMDELCFFFLVNQLWLCAKDQKLHCLPNAAQRCGCKFAKEHSAIFKSSICKFLTRRVLWKTCNYAKYLSNTLIHESVQKMTQVVFLPVSFKYSPTMNSISVCMNMYR